MATITIDTTEQQYQQLFNGLDVLRTVMTPRLKRFRKLPRGKQKLWLQKDPLLRRTLKLGIDLHKYFILFSPEEMSW